MNELMEHVSANEIPNMPCVDCIVMAICNAIMHQPEQQIGMNAWKIYKRCRDIKTYIDNYYVTQVETNVWKTSLMCIQVYFKGGNDNSSIVFYNPYVTSDTHPMEIIE